MGAGLGGEMTKLSATQLAILRRMGKGDKLCLMKGLTAYYWWWDHPWESPGIRLATADKLYRLGLTEEGESDWHSAVYRITPAGRAYLEEHDD